MSWLVPVVGGVVTLLLASRQAQAGDPPPKVKIPKDQVVVGKDGRLRLPAPQPSAPSTSNADADQPPSDESGSASSSLPSAASALGDTIIKLLTNVASTANSLLFSSCQDRTCEARTAIMLWVQPPPEFKPGWQITNAIRGLVAPIPRRGDPVVYRSRFDGRVYVTWVDQEFDAGWWGRITNQWHEFVIDTPFLDWAAEMSKVNIERVLRENVVP